MSKDEAINLKKTAAWKYLDFAIPQYPDWRKENVSSLPSIDHMLVDICQYLNDFVKLQMESGKLKKIQENYLITYVQSINEGEDTGTKDFKTTEYIILNKLKNSVTPKYSAREKETVNIYEAFKFLQEHTESASDKEKGLLSLEMLTDTHSIILKNVSNVGGKFSTRPRLTYISENVIHRYPTFATIQEAEYAVQTHLDRYNNLVAAIHQDWENISDITSISNLFKCASFLLLEMVCLHPFSDGNGRLCRLLCDYSLQSIFPFPTPIYNVYSRSKRDDYLSTVIESQRKNDPGALTAMLIECNWFTWRELKT